MQKISENMHSSVFRILYITIIGEYQKVELKVLRETRIIPYLGNPMMNRDNGARIGRYCEDESQSPGSIARLHFSPANLTRESRVRG